jgi:AraC family ethanolamine operon transcriptional activator
MQPQAKATDVHVHRDSYTDIDRQAAQLSGYDQIYRQLSRGSFAGSFTTVEGTDGTGIYIETVNQVIEQFSSAPRDQIGLLFLCGDQPSARFGARSFDPGTAVLLGPGTDVHFQTAAGTHVCVLTCDEAVLRQAGEAHGMTLPARGETRLIDNPAATGRLIQGMNALLQGALLATGLGMEPLDGNAFSMEMTTLMLTMTGLAGAGLSDQLLPSDRRAAVFRQARAVIHDTLDVVSVAGLQRRLNISRRTLEYAFQEATGLSPHAYIAAVRLDAVRRALKSSGDSIGDIAARYGIWHLGRLAGQFRDAFGMLPSETRRG